MLYYLKQEVIGEHADSVLKGAHIRYLIHAAKCANTNGIKSWLHVIHAFNFLLRDVDIWMPEMEQQEVPAAWWDNDADRSLLAGVFKHGGCSSHL